MDLIGSSSVVSMALGILAIVIAAKLFGFGIGLLMKFVSNSIVGALILMVVNFFGMGINITIVKAFLVGLFGIPGVIALIVFEKLL